MSLGDRAQKLEESSNAKQESGAEDPSCRPDGQFRNAFDSRDEKILSHGENAALDRSDWVSRITELAFRCV